MDAHQSLFYGFGQVAYALAISDGKVQLEEKQRFKEIVENGIRSVTADFSYSDIIFQILDSEHMGPDFAYRSGMKAIELGSHHLTSELKDAFLQTLDHVASAFVPMTADESEIIIRFRTDLNRISTGAPPPPTNSEL